MEAHGKAGSTERLFQNDREKRSFEDGVSLYQELRSRRKDD
jgi:hypothetical protein